MTVFQKPEHGITDDGRNPAISRYPSGNTEKYAPSGADSVSDLSANEIQRLVSDLRTHQSELEEQNEELRNIQTELETARNKFSHLYDFAPVGYFTLDNTKSIIEANLTFCNMLGIERDQVIGKSFTRFIRKDDQDIFYLHQHRLMTSEPEQSCELRLIKADGGDLTVYLESMVLGGDPGEARLIRVTVNDITLQKQAQENQKLLRDLINQCNDAIFVIDPSSGRFLDANDTTARALDFSREELLELKIFDIENSQADPENWAGFVARLREDGSSLMETEHRRSDGTQIPVEVNTRFIKHGNREYIVVSARDIRDRQVMEKQIRHMQKMNSINTMASGIAHEFNNLLHMITVSTELLLQNARKKDRSFLNGIISATRRGARLVRQILAFSHYENPVRRTTDLNQLISDLKIIMDRLLPPEVRVTLDLATDLHPADVDRGQMEQVLMNLCINAKDAMPDGGEVTIKTENSFIRKSQQKQFPHAQTGECLKLTVTDTGHGIDPAALDKIFDPFFTTKAVGKGTGLGLSVVYGIIKNHRGIVTCASKPGAGAVFKILLPKKTEKSKSREPAGTSPSPAAGTEKILLVDDDPDIIEVTAEILKRFNYSVITANSGESALEIYAANRPGIDLIILDLGMPGMGGAKCLKRLKELDPAVKVIVASGYDNNTVKQIAEGNGAKGYLSKPFKMDEVSRLVRRVLDK